MAAMIETAGETVDHHPALRPRTRHRGHLPAARALSRSLRQENIALRPGTRNPPCGVCDWSERRVRARALLERVGAKIDAAAEVRSLSMPEQQLVEIAKALGAGARILIMDEPTASLTQKEVQLLLAVVRDLRAQGVGVIYISHRLEEIFALADRVTVLRDGESVGTHPVSGMDEAALIRLMGEAKSRAIYPPSDRAGRGGARGAASAACGAFGSARRLLSVPRGGGSPSSRSCRLPPRRAGPTSSGLPPRRRIRITMHAHFHDASRARFDPGSALHPEDRRRHGVVSRCRCSPEA